MSAARAEVPAARLLAAAGPAATMGHLLHMPSHTYVRIGRWHDAVLSNIRHVRCCGRCRSHSPEACCTLRCMPAP